MDFRREREQSVHAMTGRASGMVRRRYLTRAEVARVFEVSPATVARWTREGKLPFILTPGGQRRYVREEIAHVIEESRESGAAIRVRKQSRRRSRR